MEKFNWVQLWQKYKLIVLVGLACVYGLALPVSGYWYIEKKMVAGVSSGSVNSSDPDLKTLVLDLEKGLENEKTARKELQTTFSQAMQELAASNDRLVTHGNSLETAVQEVRTALQKISVSANSPGEVVVSQTPSSSGATATTGSSSSPASQSGKVNLNTADLTALQTLPGIGATYAQRILTYRSEHGSFNKIEDLKNVTGIGDATFAKLKDLIEV